MMRVAVISAAFPPDDSPEADHMLHLCAALAKAGCEIDLLTTRGNVPRSVPSNVRIYDEVDSWSWPAMGRVTRWLRKVRPQAVLLSYLGWLYRHHPMITYSATISKAVLPGVPFVTQFHNVLGAKPGTTARARILHRAASLCCGGADMEFGTLLKHSNVIIVFSEHHGRIVTERCSDLPGRMTLLPPPAILNMSPSDEELRQRVRQRLGVKPDTLLLGYFGQVYPGKGVETLIESFRLLCKGSFTGRLAVIGRLRAQVLPEGGTYDKHIRELAEQTGYGDRIVFTGDYDAESDEGSTYLRSLDLCILPFDNGVQLNNSSLAAAVTHGLPIVTTRGTEPERPFVDGENMLMCAPKNPGAMMQAINRALADHSLRSRLADGSAKLADEWFSWDRVMDRTLAAFQGKADGNGARTEPRTGCNTPAELVH
jgi:polysaccharide biosynthesis protein PslF